MTLSAYVAAPFIDAAYVRGVHERLVSFGITPTSRWAMGANGPEDLKAFTRAELQHFAASNDADLRASDVCLVLARDGAGGEMFSEAARASEWGKAIVWSGRRTLSAYRLGVVLAEDLDDAIRILVEMQTHRANGVPRMLLAAYVKGAA